MKMFQNVGVVIYNIVKLLVNFPVYIFKLPKIKEPKKVRHSEWSQYLSKEFNHPGNRILEIGSRNVTGANLRHLFSDAEYIGFDFLDGENVDIVGDVHRLPSYFEDGEKFDLIFCSAVFEHLYAPWIAAQNMTNLLKVEGHIFVETHFSYVSHERPWNFFQFSDMGLRVLFNDGLGLEVIDCGMSNPIIGIFNSYSVPALRFRPMKELYCHSSILVKKYKHVEDFNWGDVDPEQLVGKTSYPTPKK